MTKLNHPLLTQKHTEVYHEDEAEMRYGAPHHFRVQTVANDSDQLVGILGEVDFQKGPVKEAGINGVMNEDVLGMVLTRLEHFQKTQFACRENAVAITKIEEALMWLRRRTTAREQRGIEGTHTV